MQYQSPIDIIIGRARHCIANLSFELSSTNTTYTQIPYDPKNEYLKTPFTLSTITFNNGS